MNKKCIIFSRKLTKKVGFSDNGCPRGQFFANFCKKDNFFVNFWLHFFNFCGSSSFGVDLMYTGIKSTPNDERLHEQ